jgi:hypothetical protein
MLVYENFGGEVVCNREHSCRMFKKAVSAAAVSEEARRTLAVR